MGSYELQKRRAQQAIVRMLVRKLSVAGILLLLFTSSVWSDDQRGTMPVSEGTRFVVAFPQVWPDAIEEPLPNPMLIYISSAVKTAVRVRTPAVKNDIGTKIDKTYTVNAGQMLIVSMPQSFMMPSGSVEDTALSHVIKAYGIEITSKAPISVQSYIGWTGNGELINHLPVAAWGRTYSAMCFYNDVYGKGTLVHRPGQIVVIAEEDDTHVNFTPTWATKGGPDCPTVPAGSTGTVTLNLGDVFLIKGTIDPALAKNAVTDLSGTQVTADKPIGVISGHTKVAIMRYPNVLPPSLLGGDGAGGSAGFVRNCVFEAMLPQELAGTEFVTIPSMYTPRRTVDSTADQGIAYGIDDNRGDVIRFNAIEDGTMLSYITEDGDSVPVRTLHAHESVIMPTQIDAVLWKTSKPVTCAQYGKSWANLSLPKSIGRGHDNKLAELPQTPPAVEAGQPMMEIVPSTDRWTTSGRFNGPEGMDNFFNIVFRTGQESSILLDGDRLPAATSGSYHRLLGTPFSYIRQPMSSGAHVVRSTSDTVRWCAWNYGSLDGMQQGRAYGSPVSMELSLPCADTVRLSESTTIDACGSVATTATVSSGSASCASLFMIYQDSVQNCELVLDTPITAGLSSATYTVKVIDPTRDASGTIRVVTRSGAYIQRAFSFKARPYSFSPTKIDLGVITADSTQCQPMTITNPSTSTTLSVTSLRTLLQTPGVTVPSGPFVLAPGESRVVDVCVRLQPSKKIVDTVVADFECGMARLTEVRARTKTVSDVSEQQEPSQELQIVAIVPNPGREDVQLRVVTSEAATVDVFDVRGVSVLRSTVPAMQAVVPLDIRSLSGGSYVVVLRSGAHVRTAQLCVMP